MEIKLLSSLNKEERKKVKGLLSNKTGILFKEGEACNQIGMQSGQQSLHGAADLENHLERKHNT
mgnify:CR=1 FL=1